jgi:hypothetical protein
MIVLYWCSLHLCLKLILHLSVNMEVGLLLLRIQVENTLNLRLVGHLLDESLLSLSFDHLMLSVYILELVIVFILLERGLS